MRLYTGLLVGGQLYRGRAAQPCVQPTLLRCAPQRG
jgi:hypothetical protein